MPYYHTRDLATYEIDAVVSTATDPRSFPLFTDSFVRATFPGQVESILRIAKGQPQLRPFLLDHLVRGMKLGFIHPTPSNLPNSHLIAFLDLVGNHPILEQLSDLVAKRSTPEVLFSSSFLRGTLSGQLKSLRKRFPEGLPEAERQAMQVLLAGKPLTPAEHHIAVTLGVVS